MWRERNCDVQLRTKETVQLDISRRKEKYNGTMRWNTYQVKEACDESDGYGGSSPVDGMVS